MYEQANQSENDNATAQLAQDFLQEKNCLNIIEGMSYTHIYSN